MTDATPRDAGPATDSRRIGWQAQFSRRALLTYAGALVAVWVLTDVVWGLAGGLAAGHAAANSPQYQDGVRRVLAAHGLPEGATEAQVRTLFAQLPAGERAELDRLAQDVMSGVDWFAVTLAVSLVVFGIVGAGGGWVGRAWAPAALVPALTLALSNPLTRFPVGRNLPLASQAAVFAAQVVVCAGAAAGVAGAVSRRRTDPHRRERE